MYNIILESDMADIFTKGDFGMKVIILTMSTGNGHHIASRALCEYLKSRDIDAQIVDAYKYFNKIFSDLLEKGYLLATRYTPYVYGKFYRNIEKHDHTDSKITWSHFCNSFVARQFARYISKQNPDMVVSTHPLASYLITRYKSKKLVNTKTIGIITDFCVHPYWEQTKMDYYVCANELIVNQLVKKGISEDKILPFGIPIEMKFSEKTDKSEARKMLGIEDKKTVFVITGSMGYGNTAKYIRALDRMNEDFQIISVCGNNSAMKKHIDSLKTNKKIYNYGFVNNVNLMMDASDIIITKPGGLTVSEAIAKKLPVILVDPIPGQEDRNREFLLNNGLAVGVSETLPVDEVLYELLHCETRCEQIIKMQSLLGHDNSAETLGNFIINYIGE